MAMVELMVSWGLEAEGYAARACARGSERPPRGSERPPGNRFHAWMSRVPCYHSSSETAGAYGTTSQRMRKTAPSQSTSKSAPRQGKVRTSAHQPAHPSASHLLIMYCTMPIEVHRATDVRRCRPYLMSR